MRIRQQLSPRRRRLLTAASVVSGFLLWYVLTLPVLPPAQEQPLLHTYSADLDQREAQPSPDSAAATAPGAVQTEAPPLPPEPPAPSRRPLVPRTVLPSPGAVLASFAYLHTEQALVRSSYKSLYRITLAFLLAALVAIPLGILMGSFPPIKTWIEPLANPLRFLPITAVTPLFVLWFGVDERMKIAFLFLGTVVYLLPVVVQAITEVDEVYIETAQTLGAGTCPTLLRVIVPAAWPGIFEGCRVIYGIGWTYVILAELINAQYGLGHLITVAAKRGRIEWIYALVIVILLLGIGTNEVFRQAGRRMFAWKEAS